MEEVASLYINSVKTKILKKHRIPVLCDQPAVGKLAKSLKELKKLTFKCHFCYNEVLNMYVLIHT